MGRCGLVGLFVTYKSQGVKGRGIESQSFSLLIVYVYSFIHSFNLFHVANDLSTQCDGSVEGTPGETRKKDRQAIPEWIQERLAFDSFQYLH